jgi:hypothetical protein
VAGPKRHHYVPRNYLERFADSSQLFVRRRDGTNFTTSCVNVAVESGFYDIELPGGGKSKEVEEVLADIEGSTAQVLRSIDDTERAPSLGSHDREVLSVYLALQMTRTPEQRERILFPERLAVFLDGRELTRDLVASYLAEHHLGFTPTDSEVEGAWTFASVALQERSKLTPELSMRIMLDMVGTLAPRLAALHWCVEHDRKQRFVTSDSPLVLWRPPTHRDGFEGFGIDTSNEIRLPLDPGKQLVLSKTPRTPAARVNPSRSRACNQDVAFACHHVIAAHPRERERLAELELPAKRPTLRFNTGPLLRRLPDGETVEDGEVLHMWVPRR